MVDQTDTTQATDIKEESQFGIQRIYIKDLSVEVPHSPAIFLDDWEPSTHMDLGTSSKELGQDVYEVVLTVTVSVKLKNERIAFLVEVKQAGIFSLTNFPQEQLGSILGSYCPNILYPYAREAISDAVIRAGFPHLYLAPINFESLYRQQQLQKQQQVASEPAISE